jgi:K+-transporting ATPase KdpF subunit
VTAVFTVVAAVLAAAALAYLIYALVRPERF